MEGGTRLCSKIRLGRRTKRTVTERDLSDFDLVQEK